MAEVGQIIAFFGTFFLVMVFLYCGGVTVIDLFYEGFHFKMINNAGERDSIRCCFVVSGYTTIIGLVLMGISTL